MNDLPFIRFGQNIFQGTVKGGRRQGRQKKRWELEFAKSQRAVDNREIQRKLVVKSSAVPQRPPAVKGYVRVKMVKDIQLLYH